MDKGFQCCNSWVPTPGVHLAPDASTTFPKDCIDDRQCTCMHTIWQMCMVEGHQCTPHQVLEGQLRWVP